MKKKYYRNSNENQEYNNSYNGDKITPNENELEQAVLGALIIEPHSILDVINTLNPNLFYEKSNKVICEALIELSKENKPIDALTIIYKLKEKNELENVGGAFYISQLTSKIASTANLEYHIKILQQEALRRNVISVCSKGSSKAFDNSEDVFDLYQSLQVDLDKALKEVITYEVQKVGEVHLDIIKKSYEIANNGKKSGIPSGLNMLDKVTNGWQKSDLIILAGRPSMGKTAAAVSMIMNPALKENIPVAIFSLEMSSEQLVSRMQSNISEINVSKIVKKQLDSSEITHIFNSCQSLETAPIYIDDTPNISVLELKSKARKLVKENNIQLIIVDYLQLMRSGYNIQNREQEIAEISRGLKAIAKELSIPVIALSQLSRSVESRGGDKKPMLSDLRESGQIEQDADMVMFCYRPEYYEIEDYEIDNETFPTKGLFMLLIAKHRNGELGEIPLKFLHEQTKLVNHPYKNYSNEYESKQESTIKPNLNFLNNSNNLPF
jgi:replicative DNA helicase